MSARNRPETTKMLSDLTIQLIDPHGDQRIYWAREVTFDYRTNHKVRVDFMQFKPVNNSIGGIEHGDFYCFEVKSSVEDFHSKNGHNFLGDYNYYVMPEEVYQKVKDEIPYDIGVYRPEYGALISEKRARRKNRDRSVAEMLLMMFRSAAREIRKAGGNE